MIGIFHTARLEDIKNGKITDVYFTRTIEILRAKGIDRQAVAEVRLKSFPADQSWGVLAGVEETLELLKGLPINVYCMEEGSVFGTYQPVMVLEGRYLDFAAYETALLGFLCQASGIASRAARCRMAAGDRMIVSFGARRMHPVLAPMIERNAFIGGCDGVAVEQSADLIGEKPVGTIPHALVIMCGGTVEALRAFDEVIDPDVKRVSLIDTFSDEKFEAIHAAEALGSRLFAVRLDTPSSRRGSMREILKEVRWELNLRGYEDVKLFVSGGIDEEAIHELNDVADAYGIGTWISGAPVIDFSFDIVEVDGKPIAKKGKMSGKKQVFKCDQCLGSVVTPFDESIEECKCGGSYSPALKMLIRNGEYAGDLPSPQKIRGYVLSQIEKLKDKL